MATRYVSKTGWLEAAVAWEVCASIHEEYAKGKDALYTTRHDDFVRHAEESREMYKKETEQDYVRAEFEAWAHLRGWNVGRFTWGKKKSLYMDLRTRAGWATLCWRRFGHE